MGQMCAVRPPPRQTRSFWETGLNVCDPDECFLLFYFCISLATCKPNVSPFTFPASVFASHVCPSSNVFLLQNTPLWQIPYEQSKDFEATPWSVNACGHPANKTCGNIPQDTCVRSLLSVSCSMYPTTSCRCPQPRLGAIHEMSPQNLTTELDFPSSAKYPTVSGRIWHIPANMSKAFSFFLKSELGYIQGHQIAANLVKNGKIFNNNETQSKDDASRKKAEFHSWRSTM